jgi:serine/threonine-protein kinase
MAPFGFGARQVRTGAPALDADELEETERYRLLFALGSGGMAEVFAAFDAMMNRRVALKMASDTQPAAELLHREARLLSSFSHPSIASVFDWGRTEAGRPYYAMELIPGVTLRELVRRRGPLSPAAVARLVIALCDALSAVHGLGVVHHDVTPSNVMVLENGPGRTRIKLIDFGVAQKAYADRRRVCIVGTPGYMAPEVLQGEPSDARADLYSVGALARFALTGISRGGATTTEPMDGADLETPFDAPLLGDWVRWCLSERSERRPASAQELASVIQSAWGDELRDDPPSQRRLAPTCPPPPDEHVESDAGNEEDQGRAPMESLIVATDHAVATSARRLSR